MALRSEVSASVAFEVESADATEVALIPLRFDGSGEVYWAGKALAVAEVDDGVVSFSLPAQVPPPHVDPEDRRANVRYAAFARTPDEDGERFVYTGVSDVLVTAVREYRAPVDEGWYAETGFEEGDSSFESFGDAYVLPENTLAVSSLQIGGYRGSVPIAADDDYQMIFVDQNGHRVTQPSDVGGTWTASFEGPATGPDSPDFEQAAKAYTGNVVLDADGDGTITRADERAATICAGPDQLAVAYVDVPRRPADAWRARGATGNAGWGAYALSVVGPRLLSAEEMATLNLHADCAEAAQAYGGEP